MGEAPPAQAGSPKTEGTLDNGQACGWGGAPGLRAEPGVSLGRVLPPQHPCALARAVGEGGLCFLGTGNLCCSRGPMSALITMCPFFDDDIGFIFGVPSA